jgi:phosphatidylserine/phosphatidylglycerophosphate/cardiolipin synthase-like enzyme
MEDSMRPTYRLSCSFFAVFLLLAFIPPTLLIGQTTNHVVISEFATRGPSAATDEFIELYNPTNSPIDISGWKLQYKSASGTTWFDRATLPANSIIAGRGFFLLANTSYAGAVTPDYTSSLWTSASGMADDGHDRIINAAAVEVDKVGWGTAIDPEGGNPTPNHGTPANSNSVERKALATSTADSLASGGRHAILGNGYDTDNNGNNFVTQTHGRNPQNSSSAPEPPFSSGGNGTGRANVQPGVLFANRSVDSLTFTFRQDSNYVLNKISMYVPTEWTWSHQLSSVRLSGPAFQSATTSISGDTIKITQAALSTTDSGKVSIIDLTSPSTKGYSTFNVLTGIAAGTPAPLVQHPRVRVLELVPIVVAHVNDSVGVSAPPYQTGAEVTVTGLITANYNTTRTDVYVQDGTAGINLFSFDLPPFTLNPGDSITATGSILQFRGLTEVQPDYTVFQRHATGRPVPAPMIMTCAEVNATFRPDYTEPNEGRLIRINGVTYNQTASTITDASGTTNIFIPNTFPPVPTVFDVVGILKQFKPGTPAPGPPYTTDYEIVPRDSADIIPHPGPIITSVPYEDNIQPGSVRVQWTTNTASTSIVRYGLTSTFGDSIINTTLVTNHTVTIPALSAATVYYYGAGSGDGNGTNFAPTRLFSTASPPQATGQINVYFNKSVNASLAWFQQAHGNENFVPRLQTRLDNAKRSIDVALYSLSGGVGSSVSTALINARNRGVRVRVICEYDNRTNGGFTTLSANGIPLINDAFDPINAGLGLMHNKFFVIDGRGGAADSMWVVTGSWNPTDSGTNSDYQNYVELQDPAIANAYLIEFNEMWGSGTDVPNAANSRFGARKIDNTPHRFVIGGKSVESYFSPSDAVTLRILASINAAEHSIGFQLLTLTRTDISAALVAKKNAGKKVRGDLDNGTDTGSQFNYLIANGVDVRLKTGGGGLLHHKYGIIDAENPFWNPVTITGSHNWSSSAENSNNENTLVIRDGDIANQFLQEFAARYYQFGGSDSIRVSVEEIDSHVPQSFSLAQNYPNPFNPSTKIEYAIPGGAGSQLAVSLKLFDILGREVQTLVNQEQSPGTYRVELNGSNFASGVYFYRLEAGSFVQTKRMILIK